MLFGNSVPFKTRKQENRVKNDVRMEHGVWRDREDTVGRLSYLLCSDLVNSKYDIIGMNYLVPSSLIFLFC